MECPFGKGGSKGNFLFLYAAGYFFGAALAGVAALFWAAK
jgi:hypothetical protein